MKVSPWGHLIEGIHDYFMWMMRGESNKSYGLIVAGSAGLPVNTIQGIHDYTTACWMNQHESILVRNELLELYRSVYTISTSFAVNMVAGIHDYRK